MPLELYPFGISYNDKIMKKGKEIMEKLKLAIPIQLFGTRVLELYVSLLCWVEYALIIMV